VGVPRRGGDAISRSSLHRMRAGIALTATAILVAHFAMTTG